MNEQHNQQNQAGQQDQSQQGGQQQGNQQQGGQDASQQRQGGDYGSTNGDSAGQDGGAAGQQQQYDAGSSGQQGQDTSQFAGQVREHMEVIGADGVHVGTVDHVDGGRIKLTKADSGAQVAEGSGAHEGHHHYISTGLIAGVEGDQVRLSASGANAVQFEEH